MGQRVDMSDFESACLIVVVFEVYACFTNIDFVLIHPGKSGIKPPL